MWPNSAYVRGVLFCVKNKKVGNNEQLPPKKHHFKFPKKSCVLASSMRLHRFRKAPRETFFSPVFCNVCDTCHLNQKSLFSSTRCAYTLLAKKAPNRIQFFISICLWGWLCGISRFVLQNCRWMQTFVVFQRA